MNLGDRVRILSGTEEGIITDFLANDIIEVEIEDGFAIPVQKKDLVLISAVEKQYFSKEVISSEIKQTSVYDLPKKRHIDKGIYLGYVTLGKNNYEILLINNTDFQLPYRVMEYHDSKYKGVKAGFLENKSYVKLGAKSSASFDDWPVMVFDVIYFTEGYTEIAQSLNKRIKPKANLFQKKTTLPLVDKEGFKIQLDQFEANIDTQKIKDQIESNSALKNELVSETNIAAHSIDLHAEINDFENDSAGSILEKQLILFHQTLDQAVVNGNAEVTFIHGVGNGVLRQKIHKQLSGHPHVAYFKDIEKGRFGYGATLARIK